MRARDGIKKKEGKINQSNDAVNKKSTAEHGKVSGSRREGCAMIPDGQDAATALDSTFHIGVVAVETWEWEAEASVPERHTTGLF